MKQENVKKRNWETWGFFTKTSGIFKICLKTAEYITYWSPDFTLQPGKYNFAISNTRPYAL